MTQTEAEGAVVCVVLCCWRCGCGGSGVLRGKGGGGDGSGAVEGGVRGGVVRFGLHGDEVDGGDEDDDAVGVLLLVEELGLGGRGNEVGSPLDAPCLGPRDDPDTTAATTSGLRERQHSSRCVCVCVQAKWVV